ncbi:MAG: aldo/keto reductase [Mycobacteriales bacterium]
MTTPLADTTVPLAPGGAIPLVGFGTWQARGGQAYDAVRTALDVGYRHIDTATAYGNEAEIGRAVRDSGIDRGDIFLTTKLPPDNAGREAETIEASLDALGTDHVDLWLIHWHPRGAGSVEVWERFITLRDAGRTTHIGVSNYSTEELDELITETGEAPALNQIRWSPSLYDAKRAIEHAERGVVLEGYSPFRASDLDDEVLTRIASEHGATPGQVIVRWHLQHGFVVIPKSVTPDRIAANADVFGFELSGPQLAAVDALAAG